MQSDESKKLQSDPASGTALTPVRRQTVVDLDGFKDFTNEVSKAPATTTASTPRPVSFRARS